MPLNFPTAKFKSAFESMGLWFKDRDELAVSRRNMIYSNFTYGASANLIGGNFLTGLLLLMNADDAFIGLVTIVGLLGQLFQGLSPLILERFPQRKMLMIGYKYVALFINFALVTLIPYLNYANKSKLVVFIICIMVLNLLNALASPGFAIWHIKNVPDEMRARFFSIITIGSTVVTYLVLLGGSVLADWFKNTGQALTGLTLLRMIALGFGFLDIVALYGIKEHPNEQDQEGTKLKNILIVPLRDKKYRLTILIATFYTFVMNVPGPYYSIYLLKDLGISYSFLSIFNLINIPIMILLMPFWARIIRRTSWFRTLAFTVGFYLVNEVIAAFVTQRTLFLYPISLAVAFLFSPGISLSMSNVPYINLPRKNQTLYFGFYAMMTNLGSMLGVMFGRQFIAMTPNLKIRLLGVDMQNKQIIMLLMAALLFVAMVVILLVSKKVDQQQSEPQKTDLEKAGLDEGDPGTADLAKNG